VVGDEARLWRLRWRYGLAAAALILALLSLFGSHLGIPRVVVAFIWTPLPFLLAGIAVTFL
jgi:hypothetical protein